MNLERRELIVWERNSRKAELRKNAYGNYVIFYLTLGIRMMLAFALGCCVGEEESAFAEIAIYCYLYFCGMYCSESPLIWIRENGKKCNILKKYIDVPISLRDLYYAKMAVISVNIIKISLLEELIVIFGHCLSGGDFTYMGQMFTPFYAGIVMILYFGLILGWNYHRCVRGT